MTASNGTSSRTIPADAAGSNAESSCSTERFTLSGPSSALDPRIHAYRSDIADIALAGRLIAPHYARPVMRRVGALPSPLYSLASERSDVIADLDVEEEFAVLDVTAGWAWGYRRSGHLVGYVREEALTPA